MVVLFKTCPPFTQSKLCNRQLQNWQLALDCDTYMMHTSISKLRLLVSHEQHRHAHIDRLGRTAHAPPPWRTSSLYPISYFRERQVSVMKLRRKVWAILVD